MVGNWFQSSKTLLGKEATSDGGVGSLFSQPGSII